MNVMKKILAPLTLLALLAGCPPPGTNAVELPDEIQQLSDDQKSRLRAFLTIDGVVTDEPMQLTDDFRAAELNIVIPADEAEDREGVEVKFELFMEDDPDLGAARQPPILLGRAFSSIDIKRGQQNSLNEPLDDFDDCGVAVDESFPCSVELNQNRNPASNLQDLATGIDPFQRASFIDVAPDTLQFASGVQLGEFAQQVILIENTSPDPVTLEARLVGAPGVTIERIEGDDELEGDGRSVVLGSPSVDTETLVAPPFAEVFLAVSFAPVNQFLTTGVVFVTSTNTRTGVRTSRAIKIIANADGDPRPAPPELSEIAPIRAEANLGGFPADQVQVFSPEKLANGLGVQSVQQGDNEVSGLPFTGNTIEVDFGDGPAAFPADAAFILDVPAKNRLSVALSGLESDVDLTIFELDENDNIVADRARVKRNSSGGSDEEAVELRNADPEATKRILMVLGRIDPEVTDRAEAAGNVARQAASIDEPVSYTVNAQSSATPEFTAPPAPAGGPLEGGNRVELRGLGFDARAKVFFAGRQALDCNFEAVTENDVDEDGVLDEETVFDCTVPPGSLEAGANPATIVVSNPAPEEGGDGQAATRKQAYTYEPPAPRLDSVTPDLASTDGAEGIVIRGAFFSARNAPPVVKFGNVRATDVVFVDSTRMVVAAPAQGAGVVSITVQNVLSGAEEIEERLSLPSNSRNFRYVVPVGPAPTVTAVEPATTSVDGGAVLTITGTGFVSGAEVNIDGVDATGVVVNGATSITAVAPARANPGAVEVRVINPDGQSGALEAGLAYFIPAPSLDSVIPAQGTTTGGTVTVVKGAGFRAGIQVHFISSGGAEFASPNVNRVSGSTLIVSSPSVTEGGAYDIRITNIDGQTATLADAFTYITPDQPPPVITTISPSTGTESGNDVVTITGVDFRSPQILFGVNEVPAPAILEVSTDGVDDFVRFTTPPGAPGPVIVRLINSDGQADSTFFTYVNDNGPPNITAMLPDEGLKNTAVTLLGSNFDVDGNGALAAGASLTVGTLPAVVTNATATQINFTVPNLDAVIPLGVASAQMTVEVTNSDGQSATASFRYQKQEDAPPPQITNINPPAAQVGERVTVTGSGFNATLVQVGDVAIAAGSLVTNTATSISFDVPQVATVPGVVNVRIINVDGQRDTSVLSITLGPPPVIETISPNEVPLAGGAVTLTGTGFAAGATVTVGGAAAAANVGPTQLTFTAPARAQAATVTVRVTNPDGQQATTALSYKAPDVAGGDPEVSVVIPDVFHAFVPGDELVLVGENFPTLESAFLTSTATPGAGFNATIISQSSTAVRVRVDAGVPDSITDVALYAVNLVHAGGTIVAPLIEARGPRTFLAALDNRPPLLIGEFYNPDHLTGVTLANQAAGISVDVPILNASEGVITLGQAQLDTPPGLPLELLLNYTDPVGGGAITGINADPEGALALVGRESIRIEVEGFLPPDAPLGGLSRNFFTQESLTQPGFGTIGGFRLLDGADNVVAGGQVTVNGSFGSLSFAADFNNDQTPDTVPAGDYVVEIFTDVTPALASNRGDRLLVATNPRVESTNPFPVEVGRSFEVQGFFAVGDELIAENTADPNDVTSLNPFIQDGGQGFFFINSNQPLQPGSYRLCVFPSGDPNATGCPAGPDAFDLQVVPRRACGVGDAGGGGELPGGGDRFFFGASFIRNARTTGTVDDNNACGPTTGATGVEIGVFGFQQQQNVQIEIVVGPGAPAGLQVVVAEDFEDACGGQGTCVGALPAGPFPAPPGFSDTRRILLIDPAGGDSTFDLAVYLRDDQGNCIGEGFIDFDEDGFNDCAEDCGLLDRATNPNAPEICGDGVDNNCFGGPDDGCGNPFNFGASAVSNANCTSLPLEGAIIAPRGGVTLGATQVIYNGAINTASADLALTTATPLGAQVADTLFSNLANGDLFALGDVNGTPFDQENNPFPWLIETLVPMDATLTPAGNPVALTEPILVQDGFNNGVFAGQGEVVLRARPDWYAIDLTTGAVSRPINDQFDDLPNGCNGWAIFGLAERQGEDRVVLFPSFDDVVLRYNLRTRLVEQAGFFPDGLGGMCSLTFDAANARWYFHFSGGPLSFPPTGASDNLGFCDALVCGDASCDPGETNVNCAADCAASCGNGVCEPSAEDDVSCSLDCVATCGDFVCDAGEDPTSCPTDCVDRPNFGFCGDGYCYVDERISCQADCAALAVCGNGLLEAGEQCDDGGTAPGDGCDDRCAVEAIAEIEPNDDGDVAPFQDDFFAGNAQVFANLPFAVTGDISPAGDEDYYAFTNTTGATINLDMIVSGEPTDAPCPGDPFMRVLDADGFEITANDDFQGLCPGILGFPVADGATVFIGVEDLSDDGDLVFGYRLSVFQGAGGGGVEPPPEPSGDLQIDFIDTGVCTVSADHLGTTGDDRGGVAFSSGNVFVSGDSNTGIFDPGTMSSAVSTGYVGDGIISDLSSGIAYSLSTDGANPFTAPQGINACPDPTPFVFTSLLELDASGAPVATIPLSQSVVYDCSAAGNGLAGMFAGPGFMLFNNTVDVFEINFATGDVFPIGPPPGYAPNVCEAWAHWGIVEVIGGQPHLTYISGSQLLRTDFGGGTSVVQSFANIGDACSFTVDIFFDQFYLHWEGPNELGGTDETAAACPLSYFSKPAPQP